MVEHIIILPFPFEDSPKLITDLFDNDINGASKEVSIFISKIILLLFIVGCGSPEGRGLKYSPQEQEGSKSKTKRIWQDHSEFYLSLGKVFLHVYQSDEQLPDEQCHANMAQLLILIQEFKKVGGVLSMDSDVWCPTYAQLQAMRDGIKKQKALKLQAKIDQSKREDDEEEARIRAQANR